MSMLQHQCYALPPNHSTLREPFPGLYESVDRPSIYSTLRKNVSWKCTATTFILISLVLSAALAYFINVFFFNVTINQVECLSSDCSGHGVCYNGLCLCSKGWRGSDCSEFEPEPLRCLPDCSRHGTFNIELGQCICDPPWMGIDCSQEKCDLDCGPHGQCHGGDCLCDKGWTGVKCEQIQCDPRCSEHGQCNNGTCFCNKGWNGKLCTLEGCPKSCNDRGVCVKREGEWFCSCNSHWSGSDCSIPLEKECENPDCSGHGVCYNGLCLCSKGWKGSDCSEFDSESLRCSPDCSRHGTFNVELGQCVCEPGWMGIDCSQEKCDLDCGPNGQCQGGDCVCNKGWAGPKCEQRLCDPRCLEHGKCNNGTCFCLQGWNGKLCTLEGCPKSCNDRGVCVERGNLWFCSCNADWSGDDCSIPLERECGDKIDNDNDGLIDCADSECCSSKECQNNQLCLKSADPVDILLRRQPLSPTASFFQRMQFLIEEDSVQSYAYRKAFNDSLFWTRFKSSQASVIRGQVISPSGYGLIGVRVGVVNDQNLGIVVSRESGWFDIMVNGGSAVTLDFRREPFKTINRTFFVPWNQIVVIGEVKMDFEYVKTPDYQSTICVEHDYEIMRPSVRGTWKSGFNGGSSPSSGNKMILEKGKIVQESIAIPGTDVNLIYHSHRASGYMSTIDLTLTQDRVPPTLRLVHLKISLEGNLFEHVFEAVPFISYTYSWNRRNVYRQKVYGAATATVSVGYEYINCPQIIWEVQTVQIAGHDMAISEIGGWNLDIHHRYNFHEGILQKGDGSTLYLKNLPHIMSTLMGDGQQRPLHCAYCNGHANEQRLLAPVALTSGADGSIYVGDFNLIRRITPDGMVTTIVELSASQVAYRYHLTMGPVDGKLYISDPEKHQILRTINNSNPSDPRSNLEVIVGSGVKCLPGDKFLCGDERPARHARLSYPKGIAISLTGELFIADGTNIRYVDMDGYIHTLIGDHYHKLHWKPFPCTGTTPIQKINLRWPTELAINPLDNSLHILDDHMVLKVTPDRRIRVVAGRPTHCSSVITAQEDPESKKENLLGTQVFLETPQSIAFSTRGDLYIAESDSQMINRVRLVTADGQIVKYAGMDLDCSCMENNCECFNTDTNTASTSKMSAIPSITVSPDGSLHICDQGNLRLRSVHSSLPVLDEKQEYTITSPESLEVYVFNRFGQHVSTKSLITSSSSSSTSTSSSPSSSTINYNVANSRKTIYTFSYNVITSIGVLSSVTDSSGNKIHLFRDYANQVKSIENSKGGKCSLMVSRMKMLSAIISSDGSTYNFEYNGATGLIKSRIDSEGINSIFYQYDSFGRLTSALNPTGESVDSGYSLILEGVTVRLTKNLFDLKNNLNYYNNNVIKRYKRSVSSYINFLMHFDSHQPLLNLSSTSSSLSLSSVKLSSSSSPSSSSSSNLIVNSFNANSTIDNDNAQPVVNNSKQSSTPSNDKTNKLPTSPTSLASVDQVSPPSPKISEDGREVRLRSKVHQQNNNLGETVS